MRLVAVLGYSGGAAEIHEICEARVRHAEQLVCEDDTVLLSGEADEMRGAWNGHDTLLDPHARNTRENAKAVAAEARRLGADEVLVVTSSWHAFRARALVRAALPHTTVHSSSPQGRPPPYLLARELACLVALPFHAAALAVSSRRGSRS
jgi:hypothetical protein